MYLFLVGSGNRLTYSLLLLISGDNGRSRGAYDVWLLGIKHFPLIVHLLFLFLADVNLKYFQQNGFVSPILVRDKAGLGLR